MNMKYLRCSVDNTPYGHWNTCNFWPLLFCFDFSDSYIKANWPCVDSRNCFRCSGYTNCGLYFFIVNENSNQDISVSGSYWQSLLDKDDDVYYPTFPDIYLPNFCGHGGDKIECTG